MANKKMERRTFLKALGAFGVTALVAPAFSGPVKQLVNGVWTDQPHGIGTDYQDYTAEDIIFTTCQQCNTFCTIKTYLVPGTSKGPYSSIIRKIAGNQYSPMNMVPFGQINYNTPIEEAVRGTGNVAKDGRGFRGGRTCLKGQAGIQTTYDSYRIRKPMKRVGPRGSGVWKTITWEEAYQSILEGDSALNTPGIKDIWRFVPKEQVMKDWQLVQGGKMTQDAFDTKYKDVLINTQHPDVGPKSNQMVFMAGRSRDLIERLTSQSVGTINFYDHAGTCGISSAMGNVRSFAGKKPKKRMVPDIEHAEFIIAWGANPMVAHKGPTTLAPQLTNAKSRGLKLAVVDPRYSKTAEKADMWVPVKPGTDGALALGMASWIIDHNRFDERYLINPNKASAQQDGEPTWSDATYLVNLSHPKRPLLRAKDIGIGGDEYVVIENGIPTKNTAASEGTLDVSTTIKGIKVKSVFTLFKAKVHEKQLKDYAEITGISEGDIADLAREFTSHGKKSAILSYRGVSQHSNGFYNGRTLNALNHLIGNHDWKGGDTFSGVTYNQLGGRYNLKDVPQANKAWGIPVARHKTVYEKTSLFKKDGYPAKRPWFPFGNKLGQEVLPSAAEGYPYHIKALFMSRISPVMSNPRSDMQQKFLADPKVVPLVVSTDIIIGESTKFADFVLPDLSYLESWSFENIFPILKTKFASVYQPVTRVIPDARPTEQVYIDLFSQMNLPGVGKGAFPDGSSLTAPEDYYLKRIANMAFDGSPVKDANGHELAVFEKARTKALGKFFNINRLKETVKPEEWNKVVFVLNRGGRFEAPGDEYNGNHLKQAWGAQANFYDEKAAGFKNSYTGQFFDGLPIYEEIKQFNGKSIKQDKPLQFVSWKSRNIGTHRTISNAWLREVRDDNYVWVNPIDANPRGIKTGDEIYIIASEKTVIGTAMVTQGIMPGAVGSPYNFGHFAYGSDKEKIDNHVLEPVKAYGNTEIKLNTPMHEETGYAKGRGKGFSINHLLTRDDSFYEGYIIDLLGGSPGQLDLSVEIKKV